MTTRPSAALSRRLQNMRSAGRDAGFTILEVIVAFVLFTLVSASATVALVNAFDSAHTSQQRIDAADVAQRILDQTRALAADQVKGDTQGIPPPIRESESFVWKRTITFPGSATQCSPGTPFTVSVLVYQQQTNKFLARTDSVITCPR